MAGLQEREGTSAIELTTAFRLGHPSPHILDISSPGPPPGTSSAPPTLQHPETSSSTMAGTPSKGAQQHSWSSNHSYGSSQRHAQHSAAGWKLARRCERLLAALSERLEQPVHAASLGAFRIAFAGAAALQLWLWRDMFTQLQASYLVIPYPGFGWLQPLSPLGGSALLLLGGAAAMALMLGNATRLASVLLAAALGWLFLGCASFHSEPALLLCQVAVVGCLVRWHAWGTARSLLVKQEKGEAPCVPWWQLLILQVLVQAPYVGSAAAKLNGDWLSGRVLAARAVHGAGLIRGAGPLPATVAWASLALDVAVPPLLLSKRAARLGFPAAGAAELINIAMLGAPLLPPLRLAALILFVEPHHPASLWAAACCRSPPIVPGGWQRHEHSAAQGRDQDPLLPSGSSRQDGRRRLFVRRLLAVMVVAAVVALCAAWPLSSWLLHPTNAFWLGAGAQGSWVAELGSREGWVYLVTQDYAGDVMELIPAQDPLITPQQAHMVNRQPHALLAYVRRLAQICQRAGRGVISVRAISCYHLNGAAARQLYITSRNMLADAGSGHTGRGSFLYAWEDAPACNIAAGPESRPGMPARSKAAYADLQAAAGLEKDVHADALDRQRSTVLLRTGGGGKEKLLAYLYRPRP